MSTSEIAVKKITVEIQTFIYKTRFKALRGSSKGRMDLGVETFLYHTRFKALSGSPKGRMDLGVETFLYQTRFKALNRNSKGRMDLGCYTFFEDIEEGSQWVNIRHKKGQTITDEKLADLIIKIDSVYDDKESFSVSFLVRTLVELGCPNFIWMASKWTLDNKIRQKQTKLSLINH